MEYDIDKALEEESHLSSTSQRTFVKEAGELKHLIDLITKSDGADSSSINTHTNRVTTILEIYLEQSTLLDIHLQDLVSPLINSIQQYIHSQYKDVGNGGKYNEIIPRSIRSCYKLMNVLSRVRGYKTIVKLLPHQVQDLLPVLDMLEFRIQLFYKQQQNLQQQSPTSLSTLLGQQEGINNNRNNNNILEDDKVVEWEEIYILYLWLSLLVILPFKFQSIDGVANPLDETSIAQRLIKIGKQSLNDSSKIRDSASVLLSKILTRPDMKEELAKFINWGVQLIDNNLFNEKTNLDDSSRNLNIGIYATLAIIYKKADRDKLLPLNETLYNQVINYLSGRDASTKPSTLGTDRITKKLFLKLLTRISLILLPPIFANWRYKKEIKTLLASSKNQSTQNNNNNNSTEDQSNNEINYDQEKIEQIIEIIINQGLRDKDTIVRWTSAKGIGRIVNVLDQDMGDQVVGFLYSLFEGNEILDADVNAWHGACLALAELCRRGLVLPGERLDELISLVSRSLFFDIVQGTWSVGSAVRDAACYISWALARTYQPLILMNHITNLAMNLIVVALFDREINCRKSASAAYQEIVGRMGGNTVPNGIDIVQLADYFAVGNRRNSYLELSPIIARFTQYCKPITNHLLTLKITHWDAEIRSLAAKTLKNLMTIESNVQYVIDQLTSIINQTKSDQISTKHGSLYAISEILCGLYENNLNNQNNIINISNSIKFEILNIIKDKKLEKVFKGKGGILIRTAICKLINGVCLLKFELLENNLNGNTAPTQPSLPVSTATLSLKDKIAMLKAKQQNPGQPTSTNAVATTQDTTLPFNIILDYLEECIIHPQEEIQLEASNSIKILFKNYIMNDNNGEKKLSLLITKYSNTMEKDLNRSARRGASLVLGSLPTQYFIKYQEPIFITVILNLIKALFEENPFRDIETRVNSLNSLDNIYDKLYIEGLINQQLFDLLINNLIDCLHDYTVDKRGDIGSWVRELASKLIQKIFNMEDKRVTNNNGSNLFIGKNQVNIYIEKLIQISGEKLDKLRESSLKILLDLTISQQPPNHIQVFIKDNLDGFNQLHSIFVELNSTMIGNAVPFSLTNSHQVFPYLVKILSIPNFTYPILLGLVTSIGGNSKYLQDDFTQSLTSYIGLLGQPAETQFKELILLNLMKILGNRNERITMVIIKSITLLLETGQFNTFETQILEISTIIYNDLIHQSTDILILLHSIPLFAYLSNDFFKKEIKIKSIEILLTLLSNKYPKVRIVTLECLKQRFQSSTQFMEVYNQRNHAISQEKSIYKYLKQLYFISSPTNSQNNNNNGTKPTDNGKSKKTDDNNKEIEKETKFELPEDSEDLMEI